MTVSTTDRQDAQHHYDLALDAQRKGDLQASLDHAQAAIGQDPRNPKYRTLADAMTAQMTDHTPQGCHRTS